jgi:hypothetical protein
MRSPDFNIRRTLPDPLVDELLVLKWEVLILIIPLFYNVKPSELPVLFGELCLVPPKES